MSTRAIFKCNSGNYIMNIPKNDLSIMTPDNFADNLEFIWIINRFTDETTSYDTRKVLIEAEKFYNLVKKDISLLEYHYQNEVIMPGCEHLGPLRGKGVGGVEIDGQRFCLDSGAGFCFLSQLEKQSDGTIKRSNIIDFRDRKTIETDNLGVIKILRKKKKLTWMNILPPLIEYLKNVKDRQIDVRIVWGKPKFMDYIIAYQEGGGADDWAIEEIGEMGEEAKEKLLDMLQDAKNAKYYLTIASLLLYVFPSTESKIVVKNLLNKETDDKQKLVYKALLESAGKYLCT